MPQKRFWSALAQFLDHECDAVTDMSSVLAYRLSGALQISEDVFEIGSIKKVIGIAVWDDQH